MSDKVAKIDLDGKSFELPIIQGTENESAIDISTLRAKTNHITYDNGFGNTGSTKSSVTFLNGEKGILRYRGYSIEDLCEHSSFMEVSYLLINDKLPNKTELHQFENGIKQHTMINEDYKHYFDVWPRTAHPMGILASAISGLAAFYEECLNPKDPAQAHLAITRLVAKMPTFAAYAYKKSIGQPFIYPQNKLDYCSNFLNMMYSCPTGPYEIDQDLVKALDQILIIHADHEQNCSTSAVRVIGSSQANVFAAVAGGINALWGPLHGGANQAVLEMLQEIHENGGNVKEFIAKAKDKNDPFRLMGFGHRVYKNFDPRATIIKKSCDIVLKKLGINDPLLDIAKQLEEVALKDEYFIEKKLYPNVDFYSGIIYKAMGFPVNMFTVLFSIGRLPGWIAQWKEMINAPDTKIARPRQIYTGETLRKFVPMDKR